MAAQVVAIATRLSHQCLPEVVADDAAGARSFGILLEDLEFQVERSYGRERCAHIEVPGRAQKEVPAHLVGAQLVSLLALGVLLANDLGEVFVRSRVVVDRPQIPDCCHAAPLSDRRILPHLTPTGRKKKTLAPSHPSRPRCVSLKPVSSFNPKPSARSILMCAIQIMAIGRSAGKRKDRETPRSKAGAR